MASPELKKALSEAERYAARVVVDKLVEKRFRGQSVTLRDVEQELAEQYPAPLVDEQTPKSKGERLFIEVGKALLAGLATNALYDGIKFLFFTSNCGGDISQEELLYIARKLNISRRQLFFNVLRDGLFPKRIKNAASPQRFLDRRHLRFTVRDCHYLFRRMILATKI